MAGLRIPSLIVFVVLTLVLLFLRVQNVDTLSSKRLHDGLSKEPKSGKGQGQLVNKPFVVDHGSPPVLSTLTSAATITPPSIILPTATDKTSLNSPPVSKTRPVESPTATDDTRNKTAVPLTQEDDAVSSIGTIYGYTLNDLEKVQPYDIRHPETLKPSNDTVSYSKLHPKVYNPYVDRTSTYSQSRGEGSIAPCDNPWNNSHAGEVKVFPGHLKGFPEPSVGSYELLDIDNHICFERETRLGPYGYGDSLPIDWDTVNWGFAQRQCAAKNAGRYAPKDDDSQLESTDTPSQREFLNRTAIVIRARAGTNFTKNDKINIRSLINELSLGSGGEYQVFLLIEVMNSTNIMKDEKLYRQAVQSLVPKEYWDMTELWSEKIIQNFYPMIPKNLTSARQSHWLALQRFSQIHSGFEYFWNWEIDSRYTGHHYDLLEKLSHFARVQPRKGLWERNERYYIPRIHGDYDTTFREAVGSLIWQPPKVEGVMPLGPEPPATKDVNYVWGVGEEADYISLSPIFNPNGTLWPDRDQIWGYGNIPRRATVLKQSRISRRLLDAMHRENLQGNHISSEMAPQTVALIHGLKAVYAPHPVFLDQEWQSESLEKWFNPGPNGESGSHIESPFGLGRDGWLKGSTWYRESELAMKLYNNWIGMGKVGGPEWEKKHGRMCLPPILLHPVKKPADADL